MNYALLIYISPDQMQALSPEETRSLHGDHEATASTSARVLAHYRLRPPQQTTTLRRDGDTITQTEGPSSQASEGLRALYLLESNDANAILDFASHHPAVAIGGAAEVWPLIAPGRHDPEPHRGRTGRH
jgi:hypothetical protein